MLNNHQMQEVDSGDAMCDVINKIKIIVHWPHVVDARPSEWSFRSHIIRSCGSFQLQLLPLFVILQTLGKINVGES
jgi:hypothetical protein